MMNRNFYTIGIGASAGSLAALIDFFKEIPQNLNAAFVVIPHLMRDRRSYLDEILSRHSKIPVTRVEEDMVVKTENIYVLIENTYLTCENGVLRIQPRTGNLNHASNIFLKSLADDFGRSSIAIIFSGTGEDGLEGCISIDKAGGRILVQDPASADFDSMPLAIINYDHPDEVLEPRKLAQMVVQIVKANDFYQED